MRDPGIGDCLRDILSAWGLTASRADRLFQKMGIPGCYCDRLRRWINRRKWLHKIANCLGFKVQYDNGGIW